MEENRPLPVDGVVVVAVRDAAVDAAEVPALPPPPPPPPAAAAAAAGLSKKESNPSPIMEDAPLGVPPRARPRTAAGGGAWSGSSTDGAREGHKQQGEEVKRLIG